MPRPSSLQGIISVCSKGNPFSLDTVHNDDADRTQVGSTGNIEIIYHAFL